MQKHRIFAVLLCLCLLCFAGCSEKDGSAASETSAANSTASENTASADGGSDVSSTQSSESDAAVSDIGPSSSETVSSGGGSAEDPVGGESGDGNETDPTAPAVYLTAEKSEDTVTVRMNVKNNPGVAAYTVKILYDKDKVTPKTISGVLTQVVSNLQQPNVTLSGTVTAVYANTAGILEDGELFNITFKVKDGTTGNLSFTIDAEKEDFVAPDYAYIDFIKQNISITLD